MERYCPYCMEPLTGEGVCPGCARDPKGYQPSSHHIPPGTLIRDRYLLGRVLGEGGFGITYLGLDTSLERRVAVKEYFPTIFVKRESSLTLEVTCYTSSCQSSYEKGRAQFLREARTMARLEQIPEIVRVLDHFQDNNTAYIVMEFLEGETLKDLTVRQGPLPAGELLELLRPGIRAMDAMHRAGVIHRDISPDNLMRVPDGTVKLMDFGCAKDFQGQPTQTVTLKHGFAPREQYSGQGQGPWTDVYALCATIYYCLTGRIPPRSVDRRDGEQDTLISPTQLGADLTAAQEEALLKGMAVQVKGRWQSAAELYAALYGVTLEGQVWTPNGERPPEGGHTEYFARQQDERQEGQQQSGAAEREADQPRCRARKLTRRGVGVIIAAACVVVCLTVAIPLLHSGEDAPPAGDSKHSEPQFQHPPEPSSDPSEDIQEAQAMQDEGLTDLPGIDKEQDPGAESQQDSQEDTPTQSPQQQDQRPPSAGNQQGSTQGNTQGKQPPAQPEPSSPTKEELSAQAENYASNGQYLKAGETYSQMRGLGYLSGGELGELLCSLGSDAQGDGEYEMGVQLYQQAIALGNSLAKRLLATSYKFGTGVSQSYEKAFQLNLELAQAGYGATVYYDVADAYTEGIGTARDPEQAIYWWNRYLETDDPKESTREKIQAKITALEAEL